MLEEYEYQIKATGSREGLGAKGKQREDDRRKNRAFSKLCKRGPRRARSQVRSIEMVLYRRIFADVILYIFAH